MTISTIITTYRRPLLLKRAINSALKQTYRDILVYVYDNASDDETEDVVQEIAKGDPRVKYHRHETNIGMMPNYRFAFDRIETPYFSLLSDDDYLLPHFYETALEGFQQFPDVAFSACGTLQVDEQGNLAGDPLSLWTSEGYFSSAGGLIQMLSAGFRFPVPTGIVFQSRINTDVRPNFSEEIDFFWDPDYLTRIALKHPIVVNKKPCCVYLAHSQSFAHGFYARFVDDCNVVEKYLRATRITKKGIEECSSLPIPVKDNALSLFDNYVRKNTVFFMRISIGSGKLKMSSFIAERFNHYYGFSLSITLYRSLAAVLKRIPLLFSVYKHLACLKKYVFKMGKRFKDFISKNESKMKLDSLKESYEFGKKL